MRTRWVIAALVGASALGTLAFVQQSQQTGDSAAASTAAADRAVQPIAYPHNLHAGTEEGQLGLECMYCHFSAERSVDAGMPPVSSCMGCHAQVSGTQRPEEITRLRQFAADSQSIPWVRIYKVADHVHFPHMRHVQAGVACQSCHGEVQTFSEPVQEVSPLAQNLSMGWCVSCHVESDVRRDCTVCHY